MATNAVYVINAGARNRVGSTTIRANLINFQHNYEDNARDAKASQLDARFKAKFSLWTNYYSA